MEAFHLFNYVSKRSDVRESNWQFSRQSVWQWVRYAACRNVQHLILCDSPDDFPVRKILPALFSCTRLTTLTLSNYILMHLPSHFSGFNHLITCSFKDMECTNDSLSCFISHSPFLQKLTIGCCVGLRTPIISATNLTRLYIRGEMEVLTVGYPKLRTMNLALDTKMHDLRVNGMFFHELSYSVSEIEMSCGGNVVELWFDLGFRKPLKCSAERVRGFLNLRDYKMAACLIW